MTVTIDLEILMFRCVCWTPRFSLKGTHIRHKNYNKRQKYKLKIGLNGMKITQIFQKTEYPLVNVSVITH